MIKFQKIDNRRQKYNRGNDSTDAAAHLASIDEEEHTIIVNPWIASIPKGKLGTHILKSFENPLINVMNQVFAWVRPSSRRLSELKDIAKRNQDQLAVLLNMNRLHLIMTDPVSEAHLVELKNHPEKIVEFKRVHPKLYRKMRATQLLVPQKGAFHYNRIHILELEINRHCNFRCVYCPVSFYPKKKGVIADETFEKVLQRASEHKIRLLSLNHYSEPTLDPKFVERLDYAAQHGFGLRLNTNGSNLNEAIIQKLIKIKKLEVVVNLPTIDPQEHFHITGTKMLSSVLKNIDLLIRYNIKTSLSVNTPKAKRDETIALINARYKSVLGPIKAWPTNNRAGKIDIPDYADNVVHQGLLGGCMLPFFQLNVSFEGKVFLCCMDYEQKYILGDLHRASIAEILESNKYTKILEKLHGYRRCSDDFICRNCVSTQPRHPKRLMIGNDDLWDFFLDKLDPKLLHLVTIHHLHWG